MKRTVSDSVASKFHSVSVCRAFCYLRNKTCLHQKLPYNCFCYDCRLKKLFNRILVERDDQHYLFVINVNNFNVYNDVEIWEVIFY